MDIDSLLRKPAYQLADLVRSKKVSSFELVSAAIEKAKAENPQLNAVIHLREKSALNEARQLTDHGQPFLGVPILIKGLGQQLAGEPDTNGNKLFQNNVAQATNNFVQALQQAGFIIIGQTNFPELAAGNDGGGSIRIPSSWSGLIGLKPTRGRVPTGPSDWRSWQGASINFALTRSVEDSALLLDQLQTVQPAAVFQVPKFTPGFNHVLEQPMKNIEIGYTVKSPVGTPVSDEAKQAVLDAVAFLSAQGFKCTEFTDPVDGVALMNSYYTMNAGETAAMFDGIERYLGRPASRDDMELLTYALWKTGENVSAAQYSEALSQWDQASYIHDQLHDQYPLFLTPTNAQPAPRIDHDLIMATDRKRMENITELSPEEQRQLIYDQWLPALTYTPFT